MNNQFHIQRDDPCLPHWPNGAWSLYQITGDQIADRIIRKEGKVIARHSWCGYIGMFETLQELMAAIDVATSQARRQDQEQRRINKRFA